MWWDKYARMIKAILQKQQRGWDLFCQLAKHIIKLRSRQIDQWTRKSSDIDPHWNLASGREAVLNQWRNDLLFHKWCWDNYLSIWGEWGGIKVRS